MGKFSTTALKGVLKLVELQSLLVLPISTKSIVNFPCVIEKCAKFAKFENFSYIFHIF